MANKHTGPASQGGKRKKKKNSYRLRHDPAIYERSWETEGKRPPKPSREMFIFFDPDVYHGLPDPRPKTESLSPQRTYKRIQYTKLEPGPSTFIFAQNVAQMADAKFLAELAGKFSFVVRVDVFDGVGDEPNCAVLELSGSQGATAVCNEFNGKLVLGSTIRLELDHTGSLAEDYLGSRNPSQSFRPVKQFGAGSSIATVEKVAAPVESKANSKKQTDDDSMDIVSSPDSNSEGQGVDAPILANATLKGSTNTPAMVDVQTVNHSTSPPPLPPLSLQPPPPSQPPPTVIQPPPPLAPPPDSLSKQPEPLYQVRQQPPLPPHVMYQVQPQPPPPPPLPSLPIQPPLPPHPPVPVQQHELCTQTPPVSEVPPPQQQQQQLPVHLNPYMLQSVPPVVKDDKSSNETMNGDSQLASHSQHQGVSTVKTAVGNENIDQEPKKLVWIPLERKQRKRIVNDAGKQLTTNLEDAVVKYIKRKIINVKVQEMHRQWYQQKDTNASQSRSTKIVSKPESNSSIALISSIKIQRRQLTKPIEKQNQSKPSRFKPAPQMITSLSRLGHESTSSLVELDKDSMVSSEVVSTTSHVDVSQSDDGAKVDEANEIGPDNNDNKLDYPTERQSKRRKTTPPADNNVTKHDEPLSMELPAQQSPGSDLPMEGATIQLDQNLEFITETAKSDAENIIRSLDEEDISLLLKVIKDEPNITKYWQSVFPQLLGWHKEHTLPSQITCKPHQTGSARTEGFYYVHTNDKTDAANFQQTHATTKDTETNKEQPATKLGATTKQVSRSHRVNQRRLQNEIDRNLESESGTSEALQFNRLKSRKKQLVFGRSPIHGWGLFTMEPILRDEMVIEYVGEVVRQIVADMREERYSKLGMGSSYLFRIDASTVVDATSSGYLARFMNHSCEPNCYARIISVEGGKKIVIYSKEDIEKGDEITYDYKFPIEDEKIPCTCQAPNCRKFLN